MPTGPRLKAEPPVRWCHPPCWVEALADPWKAFRPTGSFRGRNRRERGDGRGWSGVTWKCRCGDPHSGGPHDGYRTVRFPSWGWRPERPTRWAHTRPVPGKIGLGARQDSFWRPRRDHEGNRLSWRRRRQPADASGWHQQVGMVISRLWPSRGGRSGGGGPHRRRRLLFAVGVSQMQVVALVSRRISGLFTNSGGGGSGTDCCGHTLVVARAARRLVRYRRPIRRPHPHLSRLHGWEGGSTASPSGRGYGGGARSVERVAYGSDHRIAVGVASAACRSSKNLASCSGRKHRGGVCSLA